jgi:predicted metalloprotease with PDZ domain
MANLKKCETGAIACLFLVLFHPLFAQSPPIKLNVDASEAARRLLHTTMQFPVSPGKFTLLYPQWIPGEHGPTGPIEDLAGIRVTANGKPLTWARDAVNMFEFTIDIPPGVSTIDVAVEFISPPESGGFSSGGSITSQLAVLSWNQLLLYPKGTPADQLNYQATLKVPSGWSYGTALPIASESGNQIIFKPSSLTTLIDSPVQTGIDFKTVDLNPDGKLPHYLHIAADSEHATRISDDEVKHYRNLVKETTGLFGGSHYRDYHFLYTLSDHVAHFGLEHHESSDDRTDEDSLIDEDHRKVDAGLLPHEFVHSWNGKYRRPAGLATSDYSQPMKGNLLWVYEGLTEYLGEILTPRSGLSTDQEFFDSLAMEAAGLDKEEGRTWRPLEDTAVSAQVLYSARADYSDLRRSVDYYEEGTLIWLDADVTIRTLSKGRKSLDDFCKLWAGGSDTTDVPTVKPYTFDNVVATLNATQPYDWAGFLNERLQSTAPHAPLNGIVNSGYNLVYTAERSDYQKSHEAVRKGISLAYSIGLSLRDSGDIVDVHLNSPAYKAGLAPATRVIAVNGREYSGAALRRAIADAVKDPAPIALIVKDGDYYKTVSIDYHGGEKYPHLVRDKSKPDLLSDIIRPHAVVPPARPQMNR